MITQRPERVATLRIERGARPPGVATTRRDA